MPCNEADEVRSARLNGKKMAIKIKMQTEKMFKSLFLKNSCNSLKRNELLKHRHFFMNRSGILHFNGTNSFVNTYWEKA